MKKHFTFCVFAFAALAFLTFTFLPVGAAQTDVSPPIQSNTSDLVAQAVQNGQVRVIIALNITFQPETGNNEVKASPAKVVIKPPCT